MANFNFACNFLKAEDGTVLIKCRDLPELLSWPADGSSPEAWASHAIKDTIAFRIKDGIQVPFATSPLPGEFVVALTPVEVAKILLHNAMVKEKVSRVALARKAGFTLPEVTRLLNLKHRSKMDTLEIAAKSLGKTFNVTLADR